MSEIPNINSNLQNFVNKVQPKPAHNNNNNNDDNDETVVTHSSHSSDTSDDIIDDDENENTNICTTPRTNASHLVENSTNEKKTVNSPQPSPFSSKTAIANGHNNTHPHHPYYNHHNHHNHSDTNTTILKNEIKDYKNDELFLETPRSLPDINNASKNNTPRVAITTPRKAFEEVIRKMEASNTHFYNNNDNVNNGHSHISAIPNKIQTKSSTSTLSSPRSALWYTHSDHNLTTSIPDNSTTQTSSSSKDKFGDELSLHLIIKNAQKITSHQLKNHHKQQCRDLKLPLNTVLDLGKK